MLTTSYPRAAGKYLSLPLFGSIMDDFSTWLEMQGYKRGSRKAMMQKIVWMDQYLRRRRIKRLGDLNPSVLQDCWEALKRQNPPTAGTVHVLERFLKERELLKPLTSQTLCPSENELQKYAAFLSEVRGLSRSTIHNHLYTASSFLAHIGFDDEPRRLATVNDNDLESFLQQSSAGLARGTIQHTVAALRSFLRFLVTTGQIRPGMDNRIDTPRLYRQEQLPRALPWKTVEALLRAIPRNTPLGRRDHTMLFLMATYGLRSSEVIALTLDDIHWRSAVIRVPQPKTGNALELPLTDQAAAVLMDYLRKVPRPTGYRQLFLRMRAPVGTLKPTAVYEVFQAWSKRSGLDIPPQGAHCIRHSYAVHLLRQGTQLKTIGDLLGHRSAEATVGYLRLAVEDLRGVGLSVPQSRSKKEVGS